MTPIHVVACAAHHAGINTIPIKSGGSKAPPFSWGGKAAQPTTRAQIDDWFAAGRYAALAALCGPVSGNLECLDFDDVGTFDEFVVAAEGTGLGDLLARIRDGYEERTPSGGTHLLYRCDAVGVSDKLARRPGPDPTRPERDSTTLIETRGTGAYAVVAPSSGRAHATGHPWELMRGGFASIVTITPDEREALLTLARSLDEMPAPEDRRWTDFQTRTTDRDGTRPGDAFRELYGTLDLFRTLVAPHGWELLFTNGEVGYFRRPGKRSPGHSATFGKSGPDMFYVFSTSAAPLEAGRSYSPFAVYALLEHAGEFSTAAAALQAEGFGGRPPHIASDRHSVGGVGKQGAGKRGEREWPMLPAEARHGLMGDIVAALEPSTEADPAAMLATGLVFYGNAVGRGPHYYVSETRHGCNENVAVVGNSSKARKGESSRSWERLFALADPIWASDRQTGGIGSGEGIVWQVRDAAEDQKDAGVSDKRLMIREEELSSLLKVAKRDGSIASEVVRKAWDSVTLRNAVKRTPVTATNPHVSLLGHITREELARVLDETDAANGFGNRSLWICARRSKLLPDGGRLPEELANGFGRRLTKALEFGRAAGRMTRTDAATRLWHQLYEPLSRERPGLFGAITARAEAHVQRLSMVYALLDGSKAIDVPHLTAAIAFWRYCDYSARYLFGDKTGDGIADRILGELATRGPMTQTELHALFARNVSAARLTAAMELLEANGRVVVESVTDTGGRPARRWRVATSSDVPGTRPATDPLQIARRALAEWRRDQDKHEKDERDEGSPVDAGVGAGLSSSPAFVSSPRESKAPPEGLVGVCVDCRVPQSPLDPGERCVVCQKRAEAVARANARGAA